ncbi:MAG: head-tail connector protein [Syntrophomonas sp.]|nr:head-tail connector protein [Syntrophomonas sp.]
MKVGDYMGLKLITAPIVEPVTLSQLKSHLRLDAGSLAENITSIQGITTASHDVAAAYSLEGTAVEVLGYQVVVILDSGTNQAGGTVDVKLQHRDTTADTWVDVTDGAFTQVTTANHNATYELDYTAGKRYLRAVATVGVAACIFGVTIQTVSTYTTEDTLLNGLIQAAREYAQGYQNKAYYTQTWEAVLDKWPTEDYIEIPLPPLAGVTSIKYKDADGTESTWDSGKYIVDTDRFIGRVVLASGETWPENNLYPAGAIRIRFVCGYSTTTDIPQIVKQAILLLAAFWYENRETAADKGMSEIPFTIKALLGLDRVIPI